MSIETVLGKLKGVGAETLEAQATDNGLTAAVYAPTGIESNIICISVVDTGSILFVVQDDADASPADASNGVVLTNTDGPFFIACDPSKVLFRRVGGSDITINVHYFVG